MKISAHFLRTNTFAPIIILSFFLLYACGGGGGSSDPSAFSNTGDDSISFSLDQLNTPVDLNGGGIKGPLAHATVNIYKLDNNFPDFFDPSQPIATGITDANAAIQNLSLPAGTRLPLILEVDGTNSTDLITNETPVLRKLRTVITKQQIEAGVPVYATPLSTLTYSVAKLAAENTNGVEALLEQLANANSLVLSVFNFGLASSFSTFLTSPLIDSSATTEARQRLAAEYRAANEALATVVFLATNELRSNGANITEDMVLEQLARDLQADNIIDNRANGSQLAYDVNLDTISRNVLDLAIPNSSIRIRDIAQILEDELQLGNSTAAFLIPNYTPPITQALLNADVDNDGIVNVNDSLSANNDPFANVPVLPGRMDFDWFEEAKAQYNSSVPDDPIDWRAISAASRNSKNVSSCSQLQSTLDEVSPGTIIMVESGDYNECSVSITRSGTSNQPIVITSRAKALGSNGEVRFIGGNSFGNFSNQASHYIIGGFSFLNQSDSAFKLERGAGSTDNPVYADGSTDIRFTDSHFEGIGAARGSKDGVIDVGVRSHRIRIDHNSFISNYTHPLWKTRRDDGSHVATSKEGRVDHNYFGPAATRGFLPNVPYEISAVQSCCGYLPEDADELTLTLEYNIVEHPRTEHADGEVFEVKSSGTVIRNNIIWSTRGDISLRQGHSAAVHSNYLVNVGIAVLGSNHVVSNNYINGGGVVRNGISMFRWGRRQPDNCTFLPETHSNLIADNTILDTAEYGMRIGDCDFGACRPITNSRIVNNTISSSTGVLIHFNTDNEPGRSSVCDSRTTNRTSFHDQPGDADGGINSGIVFDSNIYTASGSANHGSGFSLDSNAIVRR